MSRSSPEATPQGRGNYHHGDLRRALIEAGREVLTEGGVAALSLREVARRAKVSRAAPYHHFADKAELVGAIVQHDFADFVAALRAGAETDGSSALARLTAMGLAYVRFAVSNPDIFRLLFRPELRGGAGNRPTQEMEKAASAAYQVFLETVKAAVEEGSVQGSVDDVAVACFSGVHGLATLLVDGPVDLSRRSPDKLARVVLYALGAGISSRRKP